MCEKDCNCFKLHFSGKLLELEKKALKNLCCEEKKITSQNNEKDKQIIERN